MRRLLPGTIAGVVLCGVVLGANKWPTEGEPKAAGISTDATYAVTEGNPVRVGQRHGGPRAEQAYLGSLRGPKGETVTAKRTGSCCAFKTPNAMFGDIALLDRFEVTYEGLEKPVTLFVDMYDYEKPLAPVGFTVAK